MILFFKSYLNVSTLKGEAEARLLVLDEVEGHLGVTLTLQVGDDRLTHQLGVTHHMQHLKTSINLNIIWLFLMRRGEVVCATATAINNKQIFFSFGCSV